MNIDLPTGKYVLAVSGGVDSMVLLDLLCPAPKPEQSSLQSDYGASSFGVGLSDFGGVELVVAHFNHGIRHDSELDEALVSKQAKKLGLIFEAGHGDLGAAAAEDAARRARYAFLEKVRRKHQAKAIITAHHQDDLIETALINTLRGTNRRGLTAMADNPKIVRPLLKYPKTEILAYAKARKLEWREDTTNQNTDYLRNHIRLEVLPSLSEDRRRKLAADIHELLKVNREIDDTMAALSRQLRQKNRIDRYLFSLLPDKISRELLVYWLRQDDLGEIDKFEVDRLSLALKTAKAGTQHTVKGSARLVLGKETAHFRATP